MKKNIDDNVVAGFGDEWTRFDQSELDSREQESLFNSYFSVFPWQKVNLSSEGFDMGCGSGRWAQLMAQRVGRLHCIDAAEAALNVAKTKLSTLNNCDFHLASVDEIPLPDSSQDFGYSLGVLHHIPDTQSALNACVKKLKIGAPFLVYCYYKFDNRPWWFRYIWAMSEMLRSVVSKLPMKLRYFISQIVAFLIYWPLSRMAKLIEYIGLNATNFPLYFYKDKSMYVLRTDALDRLGTRLEQRFTKNELELMMVQSGLSEIRFSHSVPYWCAVGNRIR